MGRSERDSEFGTGFLYPLALFLCHADSLREMLYKYENLGMKKEEGAGMWLYGAADHIFGFEPEHAPAHLRDKCDSLRDRCMRWRLPLEGEPRASIDDCWKLIADAKYIFYELDRHYGHDPIEAQWS